MKSIHRAQSKKNPKFFTLPVCALLLAIFSSCSEEVITVDLKDAAPKIVIEGILTDQGEPCTVKISKSGDFYKPGTFPSVSGATVILLDSEGNLETLAEKEPGLYRGNSLTGVEGRTYTLTVEAEGKIYDAVSTLMKAVQIDSLTYYFENDPEIYNEDYEDLKEGYVFFCNFTDPETKNNYYRIRLILNGELIQDSYLFNDHYSNGKNIEYDFTNWYLFKKNDTMKVELLSIDKATYDYFHTLRSVLLSNDSGPLFTSIPDNPTTNFTNGALGYFAAYSVRSGIIVFE